MTTRQPLSFVAENRVVNVDDTGSGYSYECPRCRFIQDMANENGAEITSVERDSAGQVDLAGTQLKCINACGLVGTIADGRWCPV